MEAVLKFLNANSGGLTFVITFVYVVATIAICVANIQSANASKKQLREMQKQYADENRPRIEVEFLYERRAFYGLRFINHGKETAQNVEIRLSDEFIDSLGNTNFSELLKKQKGKKCVIGVDQHYDLFFANFYLFHVNTFFVIFQPFSMFFDKYYRKGSGKSQTLWFFMNSQKIKPTIFE